MKSNLKHAIFYIVMIGMIIIAATTLWQSFPTDDVAFSDVIEMFEGERVKSFVVEQDNKLRMDVRVVLENGTVTESGSFKALTETTGGYLASMVNME